MKKFLALFFGLVLLVGLTACGKGSADESSGANKTTKLVVGASPVPHAEILEHVKPILKKKGIDLEIKEFQDYILPNKALASGELDANFYQHIPYLAEQKQKFHYDFANVGKVHIEPIGIYSKKYKNLKDLPNGATIIMSNSVSDEPRLLDLLQQVGLIKLKKNIGYDASFKDIVDNPKHLKLKAKYDAGMLPKIYQNGEGDAVMINTNFALDAGLNPLKDAVALESSESPYANIVVARAKDKDKPAIKTLVDVLQSKEVQQWILDKWKGAIVPVKIAELKK